MNTKQRRLPTPKCLRVAAGFLFGCLLLGSEWQTTVATPVTLTPTAATTRLRNLDRPPAEAGAATQSRVGGIEGSSSRSSNSSPCAHKSLSELIKTSPVILKALGAHIFNHDDDEDLRILHNSNDALLLKWQNEQNEVLASLKGRQKLTTSSSSSSSATTKGGAEEATEQQSKQTFSDAATNRAAILASMNADAILITLTPETIYKGASLLKMTPNAAEHAAAHSTSSSSGSGSSSSTGGGGSGGSSVSNLYSNGDTSSNAINNGNGNSANGDTNSGYNSGTINSSEASYLYEGQLNATVQPLSCFDENLLKMLPSDLIIFGKLITIDEQQQRQRQRQDDLLLDIRGYTSDASSSTLSQRQPQQEPAKDVLKISINGLHRWSAQFENYIWKHLGWDDWSDFTVCSVACGKGVQQRFRRCLLDNPMVNLNMNFNSEDEGESNADVETDVVVEVEEIPDVYNEDSMMMVDDDTNEQGNKIEKFTTNNNNERIEKNVNESGRNEFTDITTQRTDLNYPFDTNDSGVVLEKDPLKTGKMLRFTTMAQTVLEGENSVTEETEIMRTFEGHCNDTFGERTAENLNVNNKKPTRTFTAVKDKTNAKSVRKHQEQQTSKVKHKKHKSTKLFSTMFCEGYNIEQRNCNSFECSDDINDLLKFYRKYTPADETNTAATQLMLMDSNTMAASSSYYSTVSVAAMGGPSSSSLSSSSLSSSTMISDVDGTETNNQNGNTFTTPINMGYVQSWHNSLNFTIMLTLRVKNDSYTTATIFSIRNSTHNLYLESCKDGLRLYLERDKATEMLPIKFNLYDYHWHQVAISIQNGDFISIYADCSWTNSFVVSKRLFSLPIFADVEIGRGFNGELQQLLILPEHQERFQCSEKRISINEVKRYIIDTFIDDYAN